VEFVTFPTRILLGEERIKHRRLAEILETKRRSQFPSLQKAVKALAFEVDYTKPETRKERRIEVASARFEAQCFEPRSVSRRFNGGSAKNQRPGEFRMRSRRTPNQKLLTNRPRGPVSAKITIKTQFT